MAPAKFRQPAHRTARSGLTQAALTLLGVLAGIGLGLTLRRLKTDWTPREVMYIKFVGDLHIRFIQALILPTIVSSLISAVGSLDIGLSRGLMRRAFVYYLGTTVFAAVFASAMVSWIKPGIREGGELISGCGGRAAPGVGGEGVAAHEGESLRNVDSVLDIIRNVFPPNLIGATLEGTVTQVTDPGDGSPYKDWPFQVVTKPGSNLLGIITMALVFGVTLSSMGAEGSPVISFFTILMKAFMRIMQRVIWFFPVTTCLLLAGQLAQQKDVGSLFQTLGWYTAAHILTYVGHCFVLLPLIYWAILRRNPSPFLRNMFPAILTAFGTGSSSATLPVTLECVQRACGIDERVARFVIPIGATVNMDGTAIYRVILINYLGQLCGRPVGVGEQLNIGLMAVATSIGTAGVPGGGMTILALLTALGYAAEHYALVLPVAWLVDRFATVTNVLGDGVGAAVVLHLSHGELETAAAATATTEFDRSNLKSTSSIEGSESRRISSGDPPLTRACARTRAKLQRL